MSSADRVVAVVLAGGTSTRLGRPKQLVEYHGEPLVARVVRELCASGCADIAVVTGPYREAVERAIAPWAVVQLHNPGFTEGIASSIRVAARWAESARCGALLLATSDQPFVCAAHVDRLVTTFERRRGRVASRYVGVAGIPAVFPRVDFATLLELRGDIGARALLGSRTVASVPFEEGALDIDTAADAARLLSR
ncbi:MAG: nucleotidyltransferase family protein [Polyangiaceae bacterium]